MRRIAALMLWIMLLPIAVMGQQNGATVTGHVYDPSGAPVAGARITAKQVETGATFSGSSDPTGLYQLPFINPGQYVFTVEKQGFRQVVQTGVTLQVAQKAVMDFKLNLGAVAQTVNVHANAPILQSESGDRNWTISQQRISAVPLAGLNTIESTWFSPGVAVTAADQKIRPFDTSGSANESINGGQDNNNGQSSGNLVMVDGISVNYNSGAVAYNTISDTVQEVNVQTTMYDAQYGWSSGGVINTITKSGTNAWHGDAYDYVQNDIFNANTWSSNAANEPREPWHINMFGGSVGGPVLRNKLFVFYAFQDIRQVQPDPFVTTVPTAAERAGDFSHVDYQSGAGVATPITIYDPLSTACSPNGNTCTRTPFTNDMIPSTEFNPIAVNVLKLIPLPNAPGNSITGAGNFVNGPNQRKFVDVLPEDVGRLDYNFSDRSHAFFRYGLNCLAETRSYIYSTLQSYNIADTGTNSPFSRCNQDYTFQLTHAFGPTSVLEFRTGMNRFTSTSGSTISNGFDVSTLGFSPTFVAEAIKYFPKFTWTNYNGAGSNPESFQASPTFTTELVLAKTHGSHNLRMGLQMFWIGENLENPGNAAGTFGFTGAFTGATPLTSTSASGNAVADFLLGYPFTGSIIVNSSQALAERLWSLFAQDDFHVSPKFTLNVGVRWDYLSPLFDKHNALNYGFCTLCASPLQIPSMNLQGGLEFAGAAGNPRGVTAPYYNNFAPRIGFAYQIRPNTLLRGGYAMMYASTFNNPGPAPGYSQTTGMITSVQEGIPNPAAPLTNPFPSGILLPVGSSAGLATALGESISFADPDANIPRIQQYSLEVQHQFGANWRASVGYVGSRSSRLSVSRQLNYLPLAVVNQANTQGSGFLTASVANPFLAVPASFPYLGALKGTYLTTPTVQEQQLLVPYPQFPRNGITELFMPLGLARYNGLQAELAKRLPSAGLDFSVSYTWSKNMDYLTFLNPTDPTPSWYIDPYDIPQQLKVSAVWYLPFGSGQRFASSANPVLNQLIGGWSVSGQGRAQAGMPLAFPAGVAPTGAQETVANPSLNGWFNTCTLLLSGATQNCLKGQTPAWVIRGPYQLQTWSPYLNSIRKPGIDNLDLSVAKRMQFKERYSLTLRADFINSTNTTEFFSGPDTNATDTTFGKIAGFETQSNDPRVIMMSLRFQF